MKLVLLRGLVREAGHWLEFPSQLVQRLEPAPEIVCVDFPGCGKFHRTPALETIAAMTNHARAQLANAVPGAESEPLVVIGISMGGMVALDWAQRFPDELASLVLINSSTGDQPFWWRLRPRAILYTLVALCVGQHWRERLMLSLISNNRTYFTRHLRQWLAIQRRHPVTRRSMVRMLLAAMRFKPQTSCRVPGLVLASISDQLVSVRASRALAERYQWPIHYHPIAGHDLPLDDPEWVLSEVCEWLAP